MIHIKLLNDHLEDTLPQPACQTYDMCEIIDASICEKIDHCVFDFGAGCAESDMCGVDF